MAALLARLPGFRSLMLLDKPRPEPEPVYTRTRPMTGFFATLTDEQKARALAYKGQEDFGDLSFPRVKS